MKTNEKLGEILHLCLELQASGWGDVFFSTEGHVSKISVTGYKGGYKKDGITFIYHAYYDGILKGYIDQWTTSISFIEWHLGQLIPNPELP